MQCPSHVTLLKLSSPNSYSSPSLRFPPNPLRSWLGASHTLQSFCSTPRPWLQAQRGPGVDMKVQKQYGRNPSMPFLKLSTWSRSRATTTSSQWLTRCSVQDFSILFWWCLTASSLEGFGTCCWRKLSSSVPTGKLMFGLFPKSTHWNQ